MGSIVDTRAISSMPMEVFAIVELFEEIMHLVPYSDLFRLQRVSRLFQESIITSKRLRRRMFLDASQPGIIIPIRTSKRTRPGVPQQFDTIWSRAPVVTPDLLSSHVVRGHSDRLPNDVLLDICGGNKLPVPTLNPTLEYWCINRKMDTILLKHSPVSHAEIGLRLVPRSYKQMSKLDSRRNMLVTQPPVADVVIGRSDSLFGLFEAHNPKGVTIGDLLEAEEERYGTKAADPVTKFTSWTSG